LNQEQFPKRLLAWFDKHGRKNLPWQKDKTPYRVWVAEIMLQQTQVATAIPYYQRFMQRYNSIEALAVAPQDEVLHHWSGLGYYARARNLHKAAQTISEQHDGEFPANFDSVLALSGIGRSTAGAILACSMGQRHAILDGNVKRVLSRYFAIEGYPGSKAIESQLWELADEMTPAERVADYTQAIMDLGATLCTRSKPVCDLCPMASSCQAKALDKVADLPTRKPKQKNRRKESTIMLSVLRDGSHCALAQRPAKGIWGGLWCPYEFQSPDELEAWCDEQGLPANKVQALGELINHSFTHYDLQITPLYLNLNQLAATKWDNALVLWYPLNDDAPTKVGLAAPVEQIINRLKANL
jgi:A/G-specific adenine glycosylase